jgi:hypothetical protein
LSKASICQHNAEYSRVLRKIKADGQWASLKGCRNINPGADRLCLCGGKRKEKTEQSGEREKADEVHTVSLKKRMVCCRLWKQKATEGKTDLPPLNVEKVSKGSKKRIVATCLIAPTR